MSPIVLSWQEDLALVRTLYGGYRELYQRRNVFLPPHPKEDPQDYLIRARRPTFYNAFGRTVRALAGAPFSQPPTPEGVPAEILALYEDDIDNEGTAGDMFVRHAFQDSLVTGLSGILVDTPVLEQVGESVPTRADELAAGIRPFWTLVPKDDIVSFRVTVENGQTLLGQLVFSEIVQQPYGAFGVKMIERLRVFLYPNPPSSRIYQKTQRAKWERVEG
jgi:hypothetical protein